MKNFLAHTAFLLKPYLSLIISMGFFALSILCIFLFLHVKLGDLLSHLLNKSYQAILFSFVAFLTFFVWSWLIAFFKTPWRGHGSFTNYRHALDQGWSRLITPFCTKDKFILGSVLMILSSIFGVVFTMSKSFIPIFNHYTWDPLLIDIERFIHFGHLPTLTMMTLTPSAEINGMILRFLDFIYAAWFYMIPASVAYVSYVEDDQNRRLRFLWAKFFLWIVGGVFIAMVFASVGPMFVHQKYPDMVDPYAAFLPYFDALDAQQPLVAHFGYSLLTLVMQDHALVKLNAMSAMPSMHIATTWLVLLYTWQFKTKLKYAMLLFTVLMLFGSFTLGWHYAIDGYVGIVLSSIIWYLLGYAYPKVKNQSSA